MPRGIPQKIKQVFRYPQIQLTKLALRKKARQCKTTTELVDLIEYFRAWRQIVRTQQVKDEISGLLKIFTTQQPQTIMEIGTSKGGTLFLFSQLAPPHATIISLDLPKGRFGGGYPAWKIPLYRSFARNGQTIKLVRANSHHPHTLQTIEHFLHDKPLDFLFIDGDHTYDGVKQDFDMYRHLVRPDGTIAFHDIAPHPEETGCEVHKFWNEIKQDYPSYELVADPNQQWAGIGILQNTPL